MLFTCTPRAIAATRPASRKVVKRGNKSLAVDLHCHVHTPAADELAKQSAKPEADPMARYANLRTRDHQNKLRADLDRKLTSIEQRLADMDKMGIDVQAISTSPLQYYYTVEPDLGRQTSRVINARLAEIRDALPDRFAALGTVPLQAPELAVAELEYCMKTLGFRGIEISTHVNGVDLSDPRFEAVFAKAEELGAVIFLHPLGFTDTRRLNEHFLTNVIGNPLDTTIALSHIIFGGVLERHPRLKFVAAHGGGYLAHYPARMDHAYKVRPECHDHIKRPPTWYLKKVYFDTVVFSHAQLDHLVKLWGADHVVIGTDYPYDMGYYKPVDFVNSAPALTRAQKDAIIGGNAAKLLKIESRRKR